MGAHFALYAATELHRKFTGLILHNAACLSKKKLKLTPDEQKNLYTFVPTWNLQRAERLFIPTLLIHTASAEKLDISHYDRFIEKIPGKYLIKGKLTAFKSNMSVAFWCMLHPTSLNIIFVELPPQIKQIIISETISRPFSKFYE